jgi:hypothetical protein
VKKCYPVTPQVTLPRIALGGLRERFSCWNEPLDPYLIGRESGFTHYEANLTVPLDIHGWDGGLQAYRLPAAGMDEKSIEILHSTINGLPILRPKNTKQKGINRGLYSGNHLAIWCTYRFIVLIFSPCGIIALCTCL